MKNNFIVLLLIIYCCSCSIDFAELLFDDPSSSCEFSLSFRPFNDTCCQDRLDRDRNFESNVTLKDFLMKDLGDKDLYKVKKELGSGTFGSVFKAVHIPTGDVVALKVLLDFDEEDVMKEVAILKELRDAPNFLPIRDVLFEEEKGEVTIGLVLDYFKAEGFRQIYPTLDAYQVKVMIFETIKTLEYAHRRGIMHRDIKPLNVLMKPETLQVKVIDWGQSDYYVPNKNFSLYVSSLFYKPPELLLGYQKYDYSVDVWSTGCMLAAMAFKKYTFFEPDRTMFPEDPNHSRKEARRVSLRGQLDAYARVFGTKEVTAYAEKFKDEMALDILDYIGEYEGEPITNFINDSNADMLDSLLIDLLSKMLVLDHTKRITMKKALEHPYFDEVRAIYGTSHLISI